MKFISNYFLFLIFATASVLANEANSDINKCDQTEQVNFIINDIFELNNSDTIFLHHWANALHIKTQPKTLLNEAAFFLNKCQIAQTDLQELERHLRSKKYLRDALVKFDAQEKVSIETWDNWSLMPTVDFGRKGGQNHFSLGMKDQNLLGLGIHAEIEYFKNDQRSGYKIKSELPLFLQNNTNANIRLTNNDDGTSEAIFIEKKFVSFDTKTAYKIGFDNFNQIDTQYEQGVESKQYLHQQYYSTASWRWLHHDSADDTLRFGLGFTHEEHHFTERENNTLSLPFAVQTLPADRSFNYPFIAIEYLQKDYRKLKNVHLINHIEDFNLGWHATASLGTDVSNNDSAPTLIWQSRATKGLVLGNDFWFFDAAFEGERYNNTNNSDRLLLTLKTEYFHKFNERWAAYFKNRNQLSKNQFSDAPIVLGGETGVRGFPLQYQHGEHSALFSIEGRYYPHINIYKLLELGGAVFIDTGRIFGQSDVSKALSPWLTSVGLGARFYSTHSSDALVIHIDVIKPMTSDPNVDGVEFRISTKHAF